MTPSRSTIVEAAKLLSMQDPDELLAGVSIFVEQQDVCYGMEDAPLM